MKVSFFLNFFFIVMARFFLFRILNLVIYNIYREEDAQIAGIKNTLIYMKGEEDLQEKEEMNKMKALSCDLFVYV